METENFNFEKLKQLFFATPTVQKIEINKVKDVRPVSNEVQQYVNKYFYLCTNGDYYFWNAQQKQFVIHNKDTITTVYLNAFPDEVKSWFIKGNTARYTIVCDTHKALVEGSNINMFKGLKYDDVQTYESFSEKTKDKVELFLSYIKDVLCDNDDVVYKYILKWLSNMIKGNKNDSVLYLKGEEGIGKSTLTDFLHDRVLGTKICTKSAKNAEALRGSFNRILCGQLLVVFEELPTFSDKEWEGVSSTLKDLVTNDVTHYADKFEKAVKCANVNNYIINTNVDAIKHSDGRRYFILPVSSKRKGDQTYFGHLKKKCFNDEVGEAFHAFLTEINTNNFYAQDFPETKNKLDVIADRLDLVYKFLKEEYILKNKGIKETLKYLYDAYTLFCSNNDRKPITKIKFSNKLSDVKIESKKSHGQIVYKITFEELQEISSKNKWIHSTDEYDSADQDDDEAFDKGIDKSEQNVNVNLFLLDENRKLKNKLEELQKMIEALQPKPKAEPKVESEKKPAKKGKTIDFEKEAKNLISIFN